MATTIRFPRTMLLASSAAMLVSETGLAAAQTTTPTGWRVGATISISGENIDLHSVAAVAAADAWAVGSATGKVTGESTPIVVHWNGRHWLRVSLPARILRVIGPSDTVSVIGARSATDGWVFDYLGHWLRLNGRSWTVGLLPPERRGVDPRYLGCQ